MAAVQEQIRMSQMDSTRAEAQQGSRDVRQERAGRSAASRVFNGISLFTCCVASFVSVWLVATKGADLYKLSYANTNLQSQIKQQSAENATLNADVDQLKQPSRILKVAMNELHMQYKKPLLIPSSASGK